SRLRGGRATRAAHRSVSTRLHHAVWSGRSQRLGPGDHPGHLCPPRRKRRGRRFHLHRPASARGEDRRMIRVLVVDDDFMVAKVHCGFVERVPGFTVAGVAHSGAQALTTLLEVRPDLVLLDIYLPDMSGLEVLRQIRERATPVDVLVITAARDVDTIRTSLRGGVIHYLIKPFNFDMLRSSLERYAAAYRRLPAAGEAVQSDVD